MTFTSLLFNLRMNRLNMHICLYIHSSKARCLAMPEQDLHMYILCNIFMQEDSLVLAILYFMPNVCLQQAFPIEQNYGSITAIQKGAGCVVQNYIKLSTYASPPSILQESLKNSRRHKSPFKSHQQFLPNVLGLSRWFMTPPLMAFFVLFCMRTFFPNTRIKHIRQ